MRETKFDILGTTFLSGFFYNLGFLLIFSFFNLSKDYYAVLIIPLILDIVLLLLISFRDSINYYVTAFVLFLFASFLQYGLLIHFFGTGCSFQFFFFCTLILPFSILAINTSLSTFFSLLSLIFISAIQTFSSSTDSILTAEQVRILSLINIVCSLVYIVYLMYSFKKSILFYQNRLNISGKLFKLQNAVNKKQTNRKIFEHDFFTNLRYKREINKLKNNAIFSMAELIENRDLDTGHHVKRTVAYVSILISQAIKENVHTEVLKIRNFKMLSLAAATHDIGKISVSDAILTKPAELTDAEKSKMEEHPVAGARALNTILKDYSQEFQQTAINVAKFHHERWDGKGYPDKLSGNDIPVEARIMAIADTYDAITGERCYRKARSHEEAVKIIESEKGKQFDPELVQVFLDCQDQFKIVYEQFNRNKTA